MAAGFFPFGLEKVTLRPVLLRAPAVVPPTSHSVISSYLDIQTVTYLHEDEEDLFEGLKYYGSFTIP